MNKTRWIIFIVITVGILVLMVISSGNSRVNVSNIDVNTIQKANSQNGNIPDHVSGKIGSKVTLTEYGDFQCSACASAYPRVKLITEQYKNQLQFVFRNFPLGESHPNGKAAAGVVESAGLQGKYWEMFDKIYSSQSNWTDLKGNNLTNIFESYASELGLNIKKFRNDLTGTVNSANITKKIDYDYALGRKVGVDATPTFFLNGVKMTTSQYGTEAKFSETIDSALKKAGIALPTSNQ